MKKLYFIVFLILSCNSVPNLEILQFKNIKELTGNEIILDNNLSFVTSMNNRLITFDDHTKTNFLSVYDDSTYKLIAEIAPYGKGENEFIAIQYMRYTSMNKESGNISALVLNYLKPEYHMINIGELCKDNRCTIIQTIKNDKTNLILYNGVLNDTLALCYSYENDEYYLYNYVKQLPINNKVKVNEGILNKNNRYNLSSSAVYNINKNRYFIYYFIINRIISCGPAGENMRDNAVNKELINFNNIICNPEEASLIKSYYIDCVYDDNYVYLLCADMAYSDYENNPKSVTIDIFDWYSNPITQLKIKEHLNTIALNKEKNILYGTTYSGQLFKYILPEF